MTSLAAVPTRYEFRPAAVFKGDPIDTAASYDPVAITVEWRGGATWAVLRGPGWNPPLVWDGQAWEYEPSPSSRDHGFFARCRFTLEDALAIGARLAEHE